MSNKNQTLLITGSAGFIGSNLVLRLLDSQEPLGIIGLDNLNDYYDPSLKEYRLRKIQEKADAAQRHTYKFIKATSPTRPSSTNFSMRTTSTSS